MAQSCIRHPLVVLSLLLASLSAAASGASATPATDAAAVVIRYGDGTWTVHTASLDGGTITGRALLADTGLAIIDQEGLVCKIGIEGCSYPAVSCTCRMPDFWRYWNQRAGNWVISGQGAGGRLLQAGDIDGWAWGQASQPPDVLAAHIFDLDRLAPQRASLRHSPLHVALPFEGDSDADAVVAAIAAQATVIGAAAAPSSLSLPVSREEGTFRVPLDSLLPGDWAVTLTMGDPDGVNGVDHTHMLARIPDTSPGQTQYLPLVLDAPSPAAPTGLGCAGAPGGYTR